MGHYREHGHHVVAEGFSGKVCGEVWKLKLDPAKVGKIKTYYPEFPYICPHPAYIYIET